MFRMRNKENNFPIRTFIWRPGFNVIDDVIHKMQCHVYLIQIHAVRYATFIRSACNNAVNMRGTVKPILSGHSKIDKIKILTTNEGRKYCRMHF